MQWIIQSHLDLVNAANADVLGVVHYHRVSRKKRKQLPRL